MSIQKLLKTSACMVIIGVSAGVSYGQFQRLTAQVEPSEVAQTSEIVAPNSSPKSARFLAASVTTWTPAAPSGVDALVLSKPNQAAQPEPPLLRYAAVKSDVNSSTAPVLPLYAHASETVILQPSPDTDTKAASAASSVAKSTRGPKLESSTAGRSFSVASAPRSTVAPGTLRRFRGTDENETGNTDQGGDSDGIFEHQFQNRTVLIPHRPTVSTGTRATRRAAVRFRKTWSTGVYR